MKRAYPICLAIALLFLLIAWIAQPSEANPDVSRFFFSGDGWIYLFSKKNGKSYRGRYRRDFGTYDAGAIESIYRVFGAPISPQTSTLSLRLIEFLDYIEDRLRPGARITITSGYRHPEYNTKLRNRGGPAAKASLHQYGMAADLKMDGVSPKQIWDYVKALGFGGAGYYHGETVHIDVGPARSWDEKTSGVGTGISDDNKLIRLVTNYDIYQPGTMMTLRFIRMTAFPIGVVPKFTLNRQVGPDVSNPVSTFSPSFAIPTAGECPRFANIDQMANIRWHLPKDLPQGRYRIHARFCTPDWTAMPPEIATPEFEIFRTGSE